MKVLTKNTDYAIRAILCLALNSDKLLSSREISKMERIPFAYLRRILQELVKEGFVFSKEGINGGLKLNRDPRDISIINIIRIFQGELELSECIFRKRICPNRKTCVLRRRVKKIERKVIKEFEGITISNLIKDIKG